MLPIKPDSSPRSEKKTPQGRLPAFRAALTEWFRRHGRDLPWRRTRDPYAILVSEMMLQQTQVATVIDYYRRWLERFPDVATLAAAPEADVLHAWQGLGYYSRARNLHAAARRIVAEGGGFPHEHDGILALPGVGRYTAGAVATFAFDAPTPPVDGNIVRVLSRLLDFREPVDAAAGLDHLWETARRWQPERAAGQYNEAMMELGALICTPRAPACLVCPVRAYCAAETPERLPVKKPRAATVALEEACGWIVRDGVEVLLEKQTGKRWHGLWRLPLLRGTPGKELLSLVYPFTNHRVTLRVFPAAYEEAALPGQSEWFPLAGHAAIPMSAPHRRALERLVATAANAEAAARVSLKNEPVSESS